MQRLGRVLGNVLAVVLTVFSMQAMAADAPLAGRDFNHMTTGFPLTGGHATAACESCHVAGVFKGTAKNLRRLSCVGQTRGCYPEIHQPHRDRCAVRDLPLQHFHLPRCEIQPRNRTA